MIKNKEKTTDASKNEHQRYAVSVNPGSQRIEKSELGLELFTLCSTAASHGVQHALSLSLLHGFIQFLSFPTFELEPKGSGQPI